MNLLERSLVTKTGYDHGWEAVVEENVERVVLASALHRARATITGPVDGCWLLSVQPPQLRRELRRAEDQHQLTNDYFGAETEAELGHLLRQAARLAKSLPDAPEARYARAVERELNAQSISKTEVERLVKQRVGQEIFRESLMDYWEGACAVTGIAVPALLRASHAKGWAECSSDAERLNVYNGFLLAAHLDALFDRHLMTFGPDGAAHFGPELTSDVINSLNLSAVKLRWMSPEHEPFLAWHREKFAARANSAWT